MGGARGKILLTLQQISFAKLLAGNDKKTRDKGLQKLRSYFSSRSEGLDKFTQDDFMRVWKGLYYCMWMSDKPLIQEELAENISSLIHSINYPTPAVLFAKTFFVTMGIEWFGIDQHRLDKFLMFVRRFLRQIFVFCKHRDWGEELVSQITETFSSTVLSGSSASAGSPSQLGLTLHFIDIFLEELAKISNGNLPQHIMLKFLQPFIQHVSDHGDERSRSHIVKHIFHHLMKQSDMGIEYEERFTAWKQAGYPGESCEDMERIELDDASDTEEFKSEDEFVSAVKDPRAGRVDVILPQLQFSGEKVAEMILEYTKKAPALASRKVLYQLAEEFSEMSKGNYPLAFKLKVPNDVFRKKNKKAKKNELWGAAAELVSFEEKGKDKKQKVGKKRKLSEEENDSVPPTKLKRMELKLTRCDSSSWNIKKKRKENVTSMKDVNVSLLQETIDSTGSESGKYVLNRDSANRILESPEQKKKILNRKAIHDGAVPVKLKTLLGHSVLTKLEVPLNRWEVTDIHNEARKCSPASEEREMVKEALPSTTGTIFITAGKVKAEISGAKQKTPSHTLILNGTSASAKKVNIALQKNKEQKVSDYVKAVRESPSIPFDAAKKPGQGVLKPSPFSSPINPFYRRSRRRLTAIF